MNYPKATLNSSGIDRAIALAGGVSVLARALNLKSAAVVQAWRRNRVPSDHCPAIERLTCVPCEELRPDIEWSVLRSNAVAAFVAENNRTTEQV